MLKVEVEDTGIGVKEEDRSRLFKMFSRLQEGARVDVTGIGLGLTICKSIVEQFGGQISFESKQEGGSIFSFTFEYFASALTQRVLLEETKREDWEARQSTLNEGDVKIEFPSFGVRPLDAVGIK